MSTPEQRLNYGEYEIAFVLFATLAVIYSTADEQSPPPHAHEVFVFLRTERFSGV